VCSKVFWSFASLKMFPQCGLPILVRRTPDAARILIYDGGCSGCGEGEKIAAARATVVGSLDHGSLLGLGQSRVGGPELPPGSLLW
jgi:hypothetical protein